MRFEIDSRDQIRIYERDRGARARRSGDLPLASEDRGAAVADRRQPARLAGGRGSLWVICSLADDEPVVRAFEIDGREVEEVELVVE